MGTDRCATLTYAGEPRRITAKSSTRVSSRWSRTWGTNSDFGRLRCHAFRLAGSSLWLRGLRNQLSFTVLAALALALGSGAATTIFSVIQNVLLDPFPYTNAERVVSIMIHDVTNSRPGGRTAFQLAEFLDYQEQNHVLDEVIGGGGEDILITNGEGTEQFDGGTVRLTLSVFWAFPHSSAHSHARGRQAWPAAGIRDELQDVVQPLQS